MAKGYTAKEVEEMAADRDRLISFFNGDGYVAFDHKGDYEGWTPAETAIDAMWQAIGLKRAINFALAVSGSNSVGDQNAIAFLKSWLDRDWRVIAREWPEFDLSRHARMYAAPADRPKHDAPADLLQQIIRTIEVSAGDVVVVTSPEPIPAGVATQVENAIRNATSAGCKVVMLGDGMDLMVLRQQEAQSLGTNLDEIKINAAYPGGHGDPDHPDYWRTRIWDAFELGLVAAPFEEAAAIMFSIPGPISEAQKQSVIRACKVWRNFDGPIYFDQNSNLHWRILRR